MPSATLVHWPVWPPETFTWFSSPDVAPSSTLTTMKTSSVSYGGRLPANVQARGVREHVTGPRRSCIPAVPSMAVATSPLGSVSATVTGDEEPFTDASPRFVATTTSLPCVPGGRYVGRALDVTPHHADPADAGLTPATAAAQPQRPPREHSLL